MGYTTSNTFEWDMIYSSHAEYYKTITLQSLLEQTPDVGALPRDRKGEMVATVRNKKGNYFFAFCAANTSRRILWGSCSHIIPHSVLKSAGKDGHSIGPAGREVGDSNLGYRGYCKPCERMLSETGEQHFNPVIHVPLEKDISRAIHVEDKATIASIYHCAFSIWWRCTSLTALAGDKSKKGKMLRKLLEVVRQWLHQPSKGQPKGIQVLFMALHSRNQSVLTENGLELDATQSYRCLEDSPKGMVSVVFFGPFYLSFVYPECITDIPQHLDIPEGQAQNSYQMKWSLRS